MQPLPSRAFVSCCTVIESSVWLAGLILATSAFTAQAQVPQFRYFDTPLLPYGERTAPLLIADLDGDGDVDLIQGAAPWLQGRCGTVWLNHGNGRFDEIGISTKGYSGYILPSARGDVGDVDGDGDIDLVLPRQQNIYALPSTPDYLYRNDGKGNLALDGTDPIPFVRDETVRVKLFDVDRDGDLDLYCANADSTDRLFLNDGKGRFTDVTPTHLPAIPEPTLDVFVADFDGDGWLDVATVAGNGSSPSYRRLVLLNDRTGKLLRVTQILPDVYGLQITGGDLDGDGDVDLAYGVSSTNPYQLLLNDGTGRFTDATHQLPPQNWPTPRETWGYFEAADADGDGDLDLIGASMQKTQGNWNIGLLLNDGRGWFTDASLQSTLPPYVGSGGYAGIADLDLDGDMDFLQVQGLTGAHVRMLNGATRHLHTATTAKLGGQFELECWTPGNHYVIPYAGTKLTALDLPGIGRWTIDLQGILPLPLVPVAQAPMQKLTLPMPTDPGFAGLVVQLQAIDFWIGTSGAQFRVTNRVSTKIVR